MPRYEVVEKGYFGTKVHEPGEFIDSPEELPECSWMKPVKELSPQQKAAETKKAKQKAAAAKKKAEADKNDMAEVTFADDMNATGPVETLS